MPEDTVPQDSRPDAAPEESRELPVEGAAEAPDALEALRRERDETMDRLLRKTAEFDNFRKRTERERRETAQLAAGDVLEALLPIVDDFERALQADAGSGGETYRRGVELIYKQLLDFLARRGVRPLDVVGQPFDPRFHQAVTYESSPGRAEGEIIEDVRRGYMLGDRLLRPAMVKVAKA